MEASFNYKNVFSWIKSKRDKVYKCDPCNMCFIFQKDMLDHFVNNHKSNIGYACSFCNKYFEESDLLLMHMQNHLAVIYLCNKCEFQCKGKQQMIEHALIHATTSKLEAESIRLTDVSVERRCFACGICSKMFSQPSLLRRHETFHLNTKDEIGGEKNYLRIKSEESDVICGDCNEKFQSLDFLKEHFKVKHKADVDEKHEPAPQNNHLPHRTHFLCIFCLKRFGAKHLLENHERIHSDDIDPHEKLEMVCDFCGKCFKGASNLRRHEKVCNEKETHLSGSSTSTISCSRLSGKTSTKNEFQSLSGGENISRVEELVKSSELNETNDSKVVQSRCNGGSSPNVREFKRRYTGTKRALSYVCNYCCKGFRSKIKFLDHYFEHDKTMKSFSCLACEARFGYSSSIPKHFEMHRRDLGLLDPKPPTNLCPKCGKNYRDRASLKRHEAMVHMKVGHPCHDCSKKFSSVQALRQHERQHSGEFIYQCDLCTKKYANPSSLHNHKKIHSENKLECNLCSRSFSLKHHLTRHLARHVGFPIRDQK